VRFRIVVADDHAGMLEWLTTRLGQEFEVAAGVQDAEVAIKEVKRCNPDVVVIDLAMKPINGLEVIRRLRESGNNVPIVLITGYTDPMLRDAAFSAGAQGFVVKSRLAEELVPAVLDAAEKKSTPKKSGA
jgi:DNA-binding NarL/FixJ family response regulator